MSNEILKGRVIFYAPEKKFGFLRADGADSDTFFHIDNYLGPSTPKTDDRVAFSSEIDPRRNDRRRAKQITPIE
jgi:cold shock CspA family protein